jgi:hypothetical protein
VAVKGRKGREEGWGVRFYFSNFIEDTDKKKKKEN